MRATTYSYDGDGRRVEKSGGTIYWYGMSSAALDETDLSGNLKNEYIFFGGKRIARRDSSGNVFYYVADHLGSSREIVQAGQTSACYDADFFPYGGEIAPYVNSCPQNYKFTGKERDSESSLDNFGARYNSSSFGRFLSPDATPNGIAMADPQSWNLYSYVRNRPTSAIDVGGHWATYIHVEITTAALEGYVSAGELKQLVDEQYAMDRDYSTQDAYQHSMRAPNQSPSDAENKSQEFVANDVALATIFLGPNGELTHASAVFLGEAIHTLQDRTSPMHETASGEPRPWGGCKWCPSAAWHGSGEMSASQDWAGIGRAVALTMAAFVDADPQRAAREGLTSTNLGARAEERITSFVEKWFQMESLAMGSGLPDANVEAAARACALGNPAACFNPN